MKKSQFISWFFFFAILTIFFLPPTDPDLGWHLRCGQLIWQGQSFCTPNQFSVLLENYHWPNHYWLYQAMIYPVYRLAGLWGLTFLNSFLMASAIILLYSAIKNYPWEKMLALGLIIHFSWTVFNFGIRSQLMGLFFFSLLLWLLSKMETKPKLMFFLPLVTLLWANSHGSTIIGLILLAFFGLKIILDKPGRLFPLAFIFLLASVITLLNPFGFRIYQDAWRHFTIVKLETLIAEWVSPVPSTQRLILFSSLGVFLYLFLGNRLRHKFLAFLVLFFALAALKARRQVPFYFSVSFYLLFLSSLTKKILTPWLKQKTLRESLAVLTPIPLMLFGFLVIFPQAFEFNSSWQNYCQKNSLTYPYQAVEFLKAQSEKGNLFNRYEWGGFLIWQLPEYKVFVDGRMPAWSTLSGKSPYTIYLETLQTQPGWQETLNEYKIDWILISPGVFMDLKLRPNPGEFGWEEVYRDSISVIYKRK